MNDRWQVKKERFLHKTLQVTKELYENVLHNKH